MSGISNYKKNVDRIIRLKDSFGMKVLTPFEAKLIDVLNDSFSEKDRSVFQGQLKNINVIRRDLQSLEHHPFHHGWTQFYRVKFGKSILDHSEPFSGMPLESYKGNNIAKVNVVFAGGSMVVTYTAVHGMFFALNYRSKQKIYYPPKEYELQDFEFSEWS